MNLEELNSILPAQKYCLTVPEASWYFSLSQKKIRQILRSYPSDGLCISNGRKMLINRTAFERFISQKNKI